MLPLIRYPLKEAHKALQAISMIAFSIRDGIMEVLMAEPIALHVLLEGPNG